MLKGVANRLIRVYAVGCCSEANNKPLRDNAGIAQGNGTSEPNGIKPAVMLYSAQGEPYAELV